MIHSVQPSLHSPHKRSSAHPPPAHDRPGRDAARQGCDDPARQRFRATPYRSGRQGNVRSAPHPHPPQQQPRPSQGVAEGRQPRRARPAPRSTTPPRRFSTPGHGAHGQPRPRPTLRTRPPRCHPPPPGLPSIRVAEYFLRAAAVRRPPSGAPLRAAAGRCGRSEGADARNLCAPPVPPPHPTAAGPGPDSEPQVGGGSRRERRARMGRHPCWRVNSSLLGFFSSAPLQYPRP